MTGNEYRSCGNCGNQYSCNRSNDMNCVLMNKWQPRADKLLENCPTCSEKKCTHIPNITHAECIYYCDYDGKCYYPLINKKDKLADHITEAGNEVEEWRERRKVADDYFTKISQEDAPIKDSQWYSLRYKFDIAMTAAEKKIKELGDGNEMFKPALKEQAKEIKRLKEGISRAQERFVSTNSGCQLIEDLEELVKDK